MTGGPENFCRWPSSSSSSASLSLSLFPGLPKKVPTPTAQQTVIEWKWKTQALELISLARTSPNSGLVKAKNFPRAGKWPPSRSQGSALPRKQFKRTLNLNLFPVPPFAGFRCLVVLGFTWKLSALVESTMVWLKLTIFGGRTLYRNCCLTSPSPRAGNGSLKELSPPETTSKLCQWLPQFEVMFGLSLSPLWGSSGKLLGHYSSLQIMKPSNILKSISTHKIWRDFWLWRYRLADLQIFDRHSYPRGLRWKQSWFTIDLGFVRNVECTNH